MWHGVKVSPAADECDDFQSVATGQHTPVEFSPRHDPLVHLYRDRSPLEAEGPHHSQSGRPGGEPPRLPIDSEEAGCCRSVTAEMVLHGCQGATAPRGRATSRGTSSLITGADALACWGDQGMP